MIDVLRPHRAVEGHTEGTVDHQAGKLLDPLAVEGELVVVEVDVADTETLLQIAQVFVEVGGGVVAEAAAKDRAVAVAAGVGAAAAGDAAGVRRRRVVEDRQHVGEGKPGQLLVGGKGEIVEDQPRLAVAGEARLGPLAVDDPLDRCRVVAADAEKFGHRLLPLADDSVVHGREVGKEFFLERRDVRAAEDRADAGEGPAGQFRDPDAVVEAGGGAAQTDEGRLFRQQVVADHPVGIRARVAVDDSGAAAALLQVGGDAG